MNGNQFKPLVPGAFPLGWRWVPATAGASKVPLSLPRRPEVAHKST